MKCLYRVRPYEVTPGSANQLYKTWDTIVREALEHHGRSKTARKFIGKGLPAVSDARQGDRQVVRRVAVEGRAAQGARRRGRRILVKYQPDANNHVVDVIESQDCEAVVPGIMEFATTRPYISDWNEHYLGMGGSKIGYALMRKGLDLYNAPVREAIDLAHGKFSQDLPMPELGQEGRRGHVRGRAGRRGWLLTAEILELIESGCPERGVRAAVRLPAEPRDRPRHVRQDPPTASGSQHRVHRLRSGRFRKPTSSTASS